MSQTTITSFYNSRKRPATEDIVSSKNKIPHIDRKVEISSKSSRTAYLQKKCESLHDKHVSTNSNISSQGKLKNVSTPTQHSFVANQATRDQQCEKVAFTKKLNVSNIEKTVAPCKIETARKELSLGDIKKRLAGSSRLAELKATAERLSKSIKHLKESSDKKNLKEFKSIDVEVPLSPSKKAQTPVKSQPQESTPVAQGRPIISPRKVFVSPIKSPSKVPAYIRHAALATSSTSLPLPHHYRFLAELFRGMETVVALLYNRNETITFKKLKPSVQEMLKRSFTEKHLAQIKFLVPDFYNFEVQKIKKFSSSSQNDFELVVTPNFPNDIKIMNPSVLLERRRYFYDTLLQLVKKHHSQYLSTLDPPMTISDDKLARWHPEFELEKVSEVQSAKLPELPNAEKCSSAQDVLAKARELFKCNTKMERALEKLAQAKVRGLTEQEQAATGIKNSTPATSSTAEMQTQAQPSTSGVTLLNPALRNLPASLLEKVKAKQAAKALEAMTRSSENDHKYLIYSRLPDLARTLRNIFVTERKNVLALNIILSKLDSSFKANVSATDLQRDIKALTEQVPEWIKLHDIRNNSYLKLDKSADLKAIISKLEAQAAKFKSD